MLINKCQLVAFLSIAPKDDVRYYLNGVLLEVRHNEVGRLVSTDGFRVVVAQLTQSESLTGVNAPADDFDVIIPRTLIETLKKSKCKTVKLQFSAPLKEGELVRNITAITEFTQTMPSIDGVFPDYLRVVPMYYSGAPSQIDPSLMDGLTEFCMTYNNDSKKRYLNNVPAVTYNGKGVCKVTFNRGDLFGLVTPMQNEPDFRNPEWINLPSSRSSRKFASDKEWTFWNYLGEATAYAELNAVDVYGVPLQNLEEVLSEQAFGADVQYLTPGGRFKIEPVSIKDERIVFEVIAQFTFPKQQKVA